MPFGSKIITVNVLNEYVYTRSSGRRRRSKGLQIILIGQSPDAVCEAAKSFGLLGRLASRRTGKEI